MAQKDFVKRGRAQKKQPEKAPRPALPWLRIIITLGLLIGFAYFLWAISQNDAQAPQGVDHRSQNMDADPANSTPVDPLPSMPEEKYDYPQELTQGEVEIDRRQQEKSERPYLMQCGSFKKQQQAESMRAKMALQGLEAQVRLSDGKNGRWYRVILGPYDYKRDAETDRHVIQRTGISTCQIWYWNL